MKFKSSVGDGAFLGLLVYCLLTFAMYIFWVISATWWPAIAMTMVLFVIVLPVYFGTKYELRREDMRISSGFLSQKIPYRNIISATDADCVTPAYALNHKRICVRYLDGENIKQLYISPTNRDAFRDALNSAMKKSLATLKSQGDPANVETIEAVERAKERLVKEHELTRAEERAIANKAEEAKDFAKENLAKEIKKLDDIIDGNIEPESVVLSQEQENLIASRRVAERKLYKKVLRLKRKKERQAEAQKLREQRKIEEQRALSSENVVWETPKKENLPKKSKDEKFADKERAKAEDVKAKQEKLKQKIERKALAEEQEKFEETSVFVDKKEARAKPEIEKVRANNKPKINTAKPKKDKSAEVETDPKQAKEKSPKLTKKEKTEAKKFKKEVKVEAKKLKKEALAEAKAEKKSAAEQLAKKAKQVNTKKK